MANRILDGFILSTLDDIVCVEILTTQDALTIEDEIMDLVIVQEVRKEVKSVIEAIKEDSGFIMIEEDGANLPSEEDDYSDADVFSD